MGTEARTGVLRRILRLGVAPAVACTAAGLIWSQGGFDRLLHAKQSEASQEPAARAISVKTAYPRRDQNYRMTVERPADVEAYYRANLEAQVAGQVEWIRVAPGSRVEKDQLLLSIHVPDLLATEKEKRSIVSQRESEFALTREKLNAANVAVKTAEANVNLKRTLLTEAKAETKLREAQFERIDQLWRKDAQDKNVRDEALRSREWAQAAEVAADAARLKAEAEVDDARASVAIATAELDRVKQSIEVARADRERAAALADYALVKAPFRAAVVSRYVDPGSFVQNASTGHPTPTLTLERSDIVTVVMRVPDNFAPYILPGTEAILSLDNPPGLKVRGQVTRFAPSLANAAHDRTMRVEVDLWNDAPERYDSFFSDPKNLADLKDGPLPILPEYSGKSNGATSHRLIPGMYGKMQLVLKDFGRVALIPSQAILRQAGRTSIYVVRDGKATAIPVEVLMDDGKLAHAVEIGKSGEVVGELAEAEQVVVSNQEELSEGQSVAPVKSETANRPKSSSP